MICISSEKQLAQVSAAIANHRGLSAAEIRLAAGPAPDVKTVNVVRGLIKAGLDPLGEAFEQLRAPEVRRKLGAIYTPAIIVAGMVRWAHEKATPSRVVDPGAGSGRYIAAAARQWPDARLIACEVDPLAALVIRANSTALEFNNRLEVVVGDYREMDLTPIKGKTLFIGNPPYVRHHEIEARWKAWFTQTARQLGFRASSLAGLHAHFFLRTRQLAHRGDYGCFITSSEWLDVGYGSTIRDMLGNGLGGASLHVIDATLKPFGTTMTTGAITCFEVGKHTSSMGMQSIDRPEDLRRLAPDRTVRWSDLLAAKRWSILVASGPRKAPGGLEIGDLFRVKRGVVTGRNLVWVEGHYRGQLPSRFLLPTVTKARDLIDAGSRLSSPLTLKRVLFLPKSLEGLPDTDRELIERFLFWAKQQGADKTFTAKSRNPWFHVGDRAAPPVLATYMGRRQPFFTHNAVKARYLNIALGLYPHEPMSEDDLVAVVRFLQENVPMSYGRTYAGGLVKFEPGELEAVPIPTLEELRELSDTLDASADNRRGGRGSVTLPS
ncbi:MAG TPA: methyltransferase [Allosphingosinicella sp.]